MFNLTFDMLPIGHPAPGIAVRQLFTVIIAGCLSFSGCTSNEAKRAPSDDAAEPQLAFPFFPPKGQAIESSWLVQGVGSHPASCSFVEFDERGDYLDFRQHVAAVEHIAELTKDPDQDPLLLVFYCHGWQNNSESDDVIRFTNSLDRIAKSTTPNGGRYRVHGIYLSWRGSVFKPQIHQDYEWEYSKKAYGGQLVDSSYGNPAYFATWTPEMLLFFSRKEQAEDEVSGVPLARTVFTCANMAKNSDKRSKVVVIGHSFGALMLEKSLGQASVALLGNAWMPANPSIDENGQVWADSNSSVPKKKGIRMIKQSYGFPAGELPIDCIFFVNSAAPSIYAKELSDYFWAFANRLVTSNRMKEGTGDKIPLIVSITSSADLVTGFWAGLGFTYFSPLKKYTLTHPYDRAVLMKEDDPDPSMYKKHEEVPQSFYYERTPGHNPLLVDRWIVQIKGSELSGFDNRYFPGHDKETRLKDPESVLQENQRPHFLEPAMGDFAFFTRKRNEQAKGVSNPLMTWKIVDRASLKAALARNPDPETADEAKKNLEWSRFGSAVPLSHPSPYWIVRCDKQLISDHGDVWSDNALEMYTAIFSYINAQRILHPPNDVCVDENGIEVPAPDASAEGTGAAKDAATKQSAN